MLLNTKYLGEFLDETDQLLLGRLMHQGRATWADLADELGLTAPAIAQRVRRLEERGVISGFAALAAPEALAPVCAFLTLGVRPSAQGGKELRNRIARVDAVQECHDLGSEYLLKVRCESLQELQRLVTESLSDLCEEGPAVTRVQVVLGTLKETPAMAIPTLLRI